MPPITVQIGDRRVNLKEGATVESLVKVAQVDLQPGMALYRNGALLSMSDIVQKGDTIEIRRGGMTVSTPSRAPIPETSSAPQSSSDESFGWLRQESPRAATQGHIDEFDVTFVATSGADPKSVRVRSGSSVQDLLNKEDIMLEPGEFVSLGGGRVSLSSPLKPGAFVSIETNYDNG